MMKMPVLLCWCAGFAVLAPAHAQSPGGEDTEMVLESRRLRLGKPGQWEWDAFKDRPIDGEMFTHRFAAKRNDVEHTLRIWQRDVKLSWPVLLNGRKLGTLTTAETALESPFAIPVGALKDGENTLSILAPPALDDIEVGPVSIVAEPIADYLGGATIIAAATDAAGGKTLPCRFTLTRADQTLQPLRATPADSVAVRTGVVYARDGKAVISVPPGEYVLHAGRGFEWGVERKAFTVKRGEQKDIAFQLRREVPTDGWIAADSHIHTRTHSGHGDATVEERMLTIAGEGIELGIATEHNHHADYAPVARSTGLADRFTTVQGNEVTTKQGHFNAFPVVAGATPVDFKETDWTKLLPAIRATPGVKVITLNHPRDAHSGFVPLGETEFNAKTGQHRQEAAFADLHAMEVITSGAMQSDVLLLYRDWFALLNRGHRIAAVASSDSHDVNRYILGQGRTYVAAADADPAKLDLDEVWRSYQEGRLLVSLGLLTHLKVNDRFRVGDLATNLGATIQVEATVLGPAWVQADHIALYANGELLREQAIADAHRAGEKARITWQIPKPAHDVHLVVIATGPGVREPFWEIPRPYQPSSKAFVPRIIGSTNPIWLDADGDGKFQPALVYAQRLIEQHRGDRAALLEALKSYDEATSTLVESLPTTKP